MIKNMKNITFALLVCGVFIVLINTTTPVRAGNVLVAGTRMHQSDQNDYELPYGDGDMSYLVGYEYHDSAAFWQLGVDIAPDVSTRRLPIPNSRDLTTGKSQYYDDQSVDYVVTPQINLIFKDGVFRAGLGAFISYVSRSGELYQGKNASSEWSSLNWQAIFGLSMPVFGRCTFDLYTYYPFKDFSDFGNLGLGYMEYGALFSYPF